MRERSREYGPRRRRKHAWEAAISTLETPRPTTTAPSPVRLRRATLDDGPAVTRILRASADWYAPLVDPDDLDQHDVGDAWFRDNFPQREFWVLDLGCETVGVITLQDTGDHLYLGYVYLHTDWVGHGLGRRLLDHARREARRRGRQGLVLLCHPDAAWAVRAYEKYGFTCIASSDAEVTAWSDGWIAPYHEAGFHLFRYALDDDDA